MAGYISAGPSPNFTIAQFSSLAMANLRATCGTPERPLRIVRMRATQTCWVPEPLLLWCLVILVLALSALPG